MAAAHKERMQQPLKAQYVPTTLDLKRELHSTSSVSSNETIIPLKHVESKRCKEEKVDDPFRSKRVYKIPAAAAHDSKKPIPKQQ